jgi:hypothetical protein
MILSSATLLTQRNGAKWQAVVYKQHLKRAPRKVDQPKIQRPTQIHTKSGILPLQQEQEGNTDSSCHGIASKFGGASADATAARPPCSLNITITPRECCSDRLSGHSGLWILGRPDASATVAQVLSVLSARLTQPTGSTHSVFLAVCCINKVSSLKKCKNTSTGGQVQPFSAPK